MRYLVGLILLCQSLCAYAQSDPFPKVAASYWVEVDGAPLWQRRSHQRLAPASLTKMMTALLVAERGQPRAVVIVSRGAALESGSRIGLKAGEKFYVEDLLAATLIASANDACRALADHMAGSQESFVQRMNQRASALGLRNTHFTNACGHDAAGHYSSAQDLAVLAHALMKHPIATTLAAKNEATVTAQDSSRYYHFASTNALIGRYAGAQGLKTGHTAKAGNCLVVYAQRGTKQVLLVMLRGRDRWWDAVDILDLAFAHAAKPA
jgi:serine-type D-Ala-D-Ala carboxypeptidase (penicillin-binding protein 5/6)